MCKGQHIIFIERAEEKVGHCICAQDHLQLLLCTKNNIKDTTITKDAKQKLSLHFLLQFSK